MLGNFEPAGVLKEWEREKISNLSKNGGMEGLNIVSQLISKLQILAHRKTPDFLETPYRKVSCFDLRTKVFTGHR
jgi:hypothetical protein